ncbi:hypothetical protein MPNTM1_02155 [Mycolicibacterium parafortuitum]|uniref:SCP domain-containing protein n=1 Tax=Mycolicibacterium parafortuitum TaxID=39692 RepID=A0A375YB53_MYCPF|nr:hypothetical protein MPP7335_00026 [Mycolicibacterium parafortuitum]
MIRVNRRRAAALAASACLPLAAGAVAPTAHADNRRFNSSVVENVYAIQRQADCENELNVSPQLLQAAEWHARDLMGNRGLFGDNGSDGSTPQQRAEAAGFRGTVAQTVAIHPALAISGIELINLWYYNPAYHAIMADCTHTKIGVWSENSLDRTVVVAVYGRPD